VVYAIKNKKNIGVNGNNNTRNRMPAPADLDAMVKHVKSGDVTYPPHKWAAAIAQHKSFGITIEVFFADDRVHTYRTYVENFQDLPFLHGIVLGSPHLLQGSIEMEEFRDNDVRTKHVVLYSGPLMRRNRVFVSDPRNTLYLALLNDLQDCSFNTVTVSNNIVPTFAAVESLHDPSYVQVTHLHRALPSLNRKYYYSIEWENLSTFKVARNVLTRPMPKPSSTKQCNALIAELEDAYEYYRRCAAEKGADSAIDSIDDTFNHEGVTRGTVAFAILQRRNELVRYCMDPKRGSVAARRLLIETGRLGLPAGETTKPKRALPRTYGMPLRRERLTKRARKE